MYGDDRLTFGGGESWRNYLAIALMCLVILILLGLLLEVRLVDLLGIFQKMPGAYNESGRIELAVTISDIQ